MATRSVWPRSPPAFVRRNLTGHKILGLALAGLMYLICLSGAVTVFYMDLQRWESPRLPDVASVAPQALARALADGRAAIAPGAKDKSLAVYAPTPDNPRLVVQAGGRPRAYDADGRYAGSGAHPVTDALTELHYALHLPTTLGLIVVGLAGAGLVALVAGGLLAHPRIFRDAFLWRRGAGPRLSLADLHNRIGVWGLPFHLAIALTGAVIGLASLALLASAMLFHHGDTNRASAALFGPSPEAGASHGEVGPEGVVRALSAIARIEPKARPSYISVNPAAGGRETLTVTAELPDRLVYGETYELDDRGRLTARHHLQDGPVGKQVYASLYRLHFGSFGGLWVRWAYFVLGLGLCLVCTTGMDIWMLKSAQKGRACPRLRRGWAAFVWTTPAAMALAAALCLAGGVPYKPVFWSALALLTLAGVLAPDQKAVSIAGRLLLAVALLALVAVHAVKFGAAALAPAALGPELVITLTAVGMALLAARGLDFPRVWGHGAGHS